MKLKMKEIFVSKDFSSFHRRKEILIVVIIILFYKFYFSYPQFSPIFNPIQRYFNEAINLAIFRLPIDFLFHSMIVRYRTIEN